MIETKEMLQAGFVKKQVAILIDKDRNGKEHIIVIDTPEHAKAYKGNATMRLATMYVKED